MKVSQKDLDSGRSAMLINNQYSFCIPVIINNNFCDGN